MPKSHNTPSPVQQAQQPAPIHPLDKNGFIPLYYQIERALMEQIQSGQLSEGDPLASEEELSRQYQVSRMTARQALHGLKMKGYAFSEKGRGTFVTRPKLDKNIMHLQGFTEDMRQRGFKASSRLLEQAVIEASDPGLAEKLKLKSTDRILRLRRLRLADGIPMAIEESNIPLLHFPGLERIDFAQHSLYQALRDRYGVRVGYADETIEALHATADEAEMLTIPRRACVLSITRVIMTTQESPIEAAVSRYRGDRYRASIRVPVTTIE
ncbi:GntR family transcriptional regulator [Silvibacterium dinghuense]|uniref:GntR family transcriptional regulator n=1 Tax=Silvibacterium dinghuense TaxID=1560006 RepID=UPI00198BEF8A|nr:GntR family transcriptional regulator [Silvibacterium dinghuense]GGH08158.1 GntR family transcriptional regulator [Silvibacterium dinghuense]